MKKKIYFGIVTLIIAIAGTTQVLNSSNSDFDSIFAANVEALSTGESTGILTGSCEKKANSCIFECKSCHLLYYAISGNLGPSKNVSGTCKCGVTQ